MQRSAKLKGLVGVFALTAVGLTILSCRPEPPRLNGVQANVFVMCDSASDDNGKLSIAGTFDTIYARSFPAGHPHCSIAIRLTFAGDQLRKHPVSVRIRESNGQSLLADIVTEINPKPPRPGAPVVSQNLILNMTQLRLPAAGIYYIEFWLDDALLTTLPLYAVLADQ